MPPPPVYECQLHHAPDRLYCRIRGELGLDGISDLLATVMGWLMGHTGVVQIDLRETDYLDADAIQGLYRTHIRANSRGSRLILVTRSFHDRLLHFVGLDSVFNTAGTISDPKE